MICYQTFHTSSDPFPLPFRPVAAVMVCLLVLDRWPPTCTQADGAVCFTYCFVLSLPCPKMASIPWVLSQYAPAHCVPTPALLWRFDRCPNAQHCCGDVSDNSPDLEV